MRSIISLLLSLSAIVSSLSGGLPAGPAEPAPSPAPGPEEVLAALRPAAGAPAFEDIRYVHYDPEPFYEGADLLRDRALAGDSDGVISLYDQLRQEFLYADSLSVITMIRSDQDIYDEYWAEEYNYMNLLCSQLRDALFTAAGAVLDTDCADALAGHVGPDTADLFRNYAPMTPEELDAADRELALIDQYQELFDTIDRVTFEYLGETWNQEKLFGFPGEALAERDYDGYLTVYTGLQRELNARFAPIYIELAELWRAEARSAGYDIFSDYAYSRVYGRDYTPAEAQRFCDAVKPIAREYYADLYYSDMVYEADRVRPVLEPEELLTLLGQYLPRVDEALLEPWTDLLQRGLYDLSPAGDGRYNGSYTTVAPYFDFPFLFVSLEADCYDLITVTHEFGHFCDYWLNPPADTFAQVDNLDLSEIHSNALQALFTGFYGEIYDDGADVAEFINLSSLLENIIDGCLYDEFQRRVLDSGEPVTPESLNAVYTQVCAEYGVYDQRDWDSTWVYIGHNFEQPLYYISYAASAMAALQIWDLAREDFGGAAAVYMDVLRRGSYGDGYFTVLEDCGLLPFREEGAVETVCRPALDRLIALDRAHGA